MLTAAVRLRWLSIAPLGRPVVPPVYCTTQTSSGETSGQRGGGAASGSGRMRASHATGSGATGEGPHAASSPTSRRSTAPCSSSPSAAGSRPGRLVVMSVRAPLSCSLNASSRGASSVLRCTTRAPVRATAKKLTGCHGVFGR